MHRDALFLETVTRETVRGSGAVAKGREFCCWCRYDASNNAFRKFCVRGRSKRV
uniref:Uncharacterized protein n=1 Tax=uncultured marine virus TaxID=186617 RepID=A0A0F7L2K2_9VIRU|nr:hypothetical protein [uncultured marine virus]